MAAGATCVLDTAFGDGAAFLRAWRTFADGESGTGLLHYAGLMAADQWPQAPKADRSSGHPSAEPTATTSSFHTTHALELGQALSALRLAGPPAPGFYRLVFAQGRVLLTLCIGPRATSLAQLALQADHIILDAVQAWTANELHLLQALAGHGTTLTWAGADRHASDMPTLDPRLWKPHPGGALVFDPTWTLRSSRRASLRRFEKPGRCTVIGAGISGALVARALALRGWQVTVLEQAHTPAAAASGLPAGLVSASGNSPADPLYSLTRSAYHLTRQTLQTMLVQGQDWEEGGAMLASAPGSRKGKSSTEDAAASEEVASPEDANAHSAWRSEALWLKPQTWIRACLATPGVTLRCEAAVENLRFTGSHWKALDANGQELASSELLVLCNAMDAARLLGPPKDAAADPLSPAARRALRQLHPMYGSVSSGPAADLLSRPTLPVHGQGHFLPAVPGAEGLQWLAGAGFESVGSASDADCHQANLARVAQLVPGLAGPLQAQLEAGQLSLWRGQRCISHDRLPLVGSATVGGENGLWMCLAMGARGLTFAALCAELLSARLMGEPLPLPKRLARLLDVQRLQNRSTHKSD